MELRITNYYHPKLCDDMNIHTVQITQRGRRKILGTNNSPWLEGVMSTGFADTIKENLQYKRLITNLKLSQKTTTDLRDQFLSINSADEICFDHAMDWDPKEKESERLDNKLILNIIRLRLLKNWSIPSLWAKFGVSKDQISQIIRWI